MTLKSPTKLSILFDIFKRKCNDSTAHGLPRVFGSDLFGLRILWAIFFFIGIVGATIVKDYYSFPFATNIEVYESYLEDFPAISICNLFSFRNDQSVTKILNKSNLTRNLILRDESNAIQEVRRAYKYLASNILNNLFSNFFSFRNNQSFESNSEFNDFIFSCYFNGKKCDDKNFTSFYTFGYGKCYTFNNETLGIKKTSKTGPESGLMLEIFTESPGIQDLFVEKRGIYLAVHNNTMNPSTTFDGVKISVGKSAEIGIKRTFYQKLSEPFSNCRKNTSISLPTDSEFYNRTVNLGLYNRKNCFEICLLYKFIIPKCNCSDPQVMNNDFRANFCKSFKEIDCIERVRERFDSDDLSKYCGNECPKSCERMEYNYQISYSDYPSKFYYDMVKKQKNVRDKFENLTYEQIKQSILMVNVFYQDLSSTFIKESRLISFTDLIASIGGLLGLLLGCSVLTFLEPVSILIEIIYRFFKLRSKTNPSNESSNQNF